MLSLDYTNLKKLLAERSQFLQHLIQESSQSLLSSPLGEIRFNKTHGRIQYYHKTMSGKGLGNYIRKKDQEFASQLAQKEYNVRVIKAAEAELHSIQSFLMHFPEKHAEDVFSSLSPCLQPLVVPFYEPDDVFLRHWLAVEYSSEIDIEADSPFHTMRGEAVRSKSEVIIANLLEQYHIPYRYEYPLKLTGLGTVHPDFTILKKDTRQEFLWEHLGMMDDPEYVQKALRKIKFYHKNGYYEGGSLILTYESSFAPLDIHDAESIIKQFLL